MIHRHASSRLLGALSSAVLGALVGCASAPCPDCPPDPPKLAVIQFELAGKSVNAKDACVKDEGIVRWVLPGSSLKFVPKWLGDLFPNAPLPKCDGDHCEIQLPKFGADVCIPYRGTVTVNGKDYSIDPTIRIRP